MTNTKHQGFEASLGDQNRFQVMNKKVNVICIWNISTLDDHVRVNQIQGLNKNYGNV